MLQNYIRKSLNTRKEKSPITFFQYRSFYYYLQRWNFSRHYQFWGFVYLLLQWIVLHSSRMSLQPPGWYYSYTLYADCAQGIQVGNAPKGARTIFPILGGNFTGPRLSGVYNLWHTIPLVWVISWFISGSVLNLGADWGLTDSKGTFSADTRYHLQTKDGS